MQPLGVLEQSVRKPPLDWTAVPQGVELMGLSTCGAERRAEGSKGYVMRLPTLAVIALGIQERVAVPEANGVEHLQHWQACLAGWSMGMQLSKLQRQRHFVGEEY